MINGPVDLTPCGGRCRREGCQFTPTNFCPHFQILSTTITSKDYSKPSFVEDVSVSGWHNEVSVCTVACVCPPPTREAHCGSPVEPEAGVTCDTQLRSCWEDGVGLLQTRGQRKSCRCKERKLEQKGGDRFAGQGGWGPLDHHPSLLPCRMQGEGTTGKTLDGLGISRGQPYHWASTQIPELMLGPRAAAKESCHTGHELIGGDHMDRCLEDPLGMSGLYQPTYLGAERWWWSVTTTVNRIKVGCNKTGIKLMLMQQVFGYQLDKI